MISTSVRFAARPEVAFPYFTDPQLMVTWIGEQLDLDARPFGRPGLQRSLRPRQLRRSGATAPGPGDRFSAARLIP